jgi:hypothetical protein
VVAELFAYRVVLNGIVLARSTPETVFTAYMTYRAFEGRGHHHASAFTDRRERQSAPGLWRLHQAWLIGCRRPSRMGFRRSKKCRSKIQARQTGGAHATRRPALMFNGHARIVHQDRRRPALPCRITGRLHTGSSPRRNSHDRICAILAQEMRVKM